MTEPSLPEYLTTEQVAEWLQVSNGSLVQDRYLGRGLPYIRIGRKIRYDRQQVLNHLADNTITGGAA